MIFRCLCGKSGLTPLGPVAKLTHYNQRRRPLAPDEWPKPVPLRLPVHRSVRAHELCDGGEEGPRGRPDANEVTCPQCGGRQLAVNRCARCPVNELEYVRAHSAAGRLFERVLELEFDCAHFAVPWDEVTAEEVGGLQVLQDERERYQRERQREKQPNAFPS